MADKLTKVKIDGFTYQGGTDIRFDSEVKGFGLRVYPGGRKSFIVQYRLKGQKKRITLAPYGVLTLIEARERAKKMLGQVSDGLDPVQERRRARIQGTLKQLSDAYFAEARERGKKTVDRMEARFKRNVPKTWLARSAGDITRAEITALRSKIGKQGHYEANRTIQILRAMYGRGLTGGYDTVNDGDSEGIWFFPPGAENPAAKVELYAEKKRKRFVRESELPELAKQIDACANVYIRGALWLYLLTGARKSEMLALRREKHDSEPYFEPAQRQIVIPDPKSEGDSDQTIPLSDMALAILGALPEQEGNPYFLPGRRKGQHLANIDGRWQEIRAAAKCDGLRLHDLRRTVGSWLSAAGVDLNTIKHGLRHASLSTTLTYARLGADPARQALDDHSKKLMEVAGKLRLQTANEG